MEVAFKNSLEIKDIITHLQNPRPKMTLFGQHSVNEEQCLMRFHLIPSHLPLSSSLCFWTALLHIQHAELTCLSYLTAAFQSFSKRDLKPDLQQTETGMWLHIGFSVKIAYYYYQDAREGMSRTESTVHSAVQCCAVILCFGIWRNRVSSSNSFTKCTWSGEVWHRKGCLLIVWHCSRVMWKSAGV